MRNPYYWRFKLPGCTEMKAMYVIKYNMLLFVQNIWLKHCDGLYSFSFVKMCLLIYLFFLKY